MGTKDGRSSRVRVHYNGQAMDSRVIGKRRRLYSQSEMGRVLGVSAKTVGRIEKRPFDPLLLAYLAAIGYRVTLNPKRKGEGGWSLLDEMQASSGLVLG